ncbi:MAG: hypothetical protein ACRD0K_06220 [Egibacteraceae bacterium]
MTYETVHRTILVLDIEGSGRPDRTDATRADLHDKLYRLLEEALKRASITPGDHEVHDRGDGVLVLVDGVTKSRLLNEFVLQLAAGLSQHNKSASPAAQMRLRAAIHAGEIALEQRGPNGTALYATFRLADCPPLRNALASSKAALAVIVSDELYQSVVRQYPDLISDEDYEEVTVSVKEFSGRAWITLRGSKRGDPPADQTPAPPRPNPDAPKSVTEGGVVFHGPTKVSGNVAGRDQTVTYPSASKKPRRRPTND